MFGRGITVPKGKKVTFRGYNIGSLGSREFHLEEDVTIKLASTYTPLVDQRVTKWGELAVQATNMVFGSKLPDAGFKQLGFQQWSGTEPLEMSFTIGIYVEKNGALEDVVKPAKDFMKMVAPEDLGKGGLRAPGPSALSMIFTNNTEARKQMVTIQLGSLTIHSCIIQGIEPTFAVDIDSTGCPIWCKMRIDAKTVFTANTSMIDDMFLGGL